MATFWREQSFTQQQTVMRDFSQDGKLQSLAPRTPAREQKPAVSVASHSDATVPTLATEATYLGSRALLDLIRLGPASSGWTSVHLNCPGSQLLQLFWEVGGRSVGQLLLRPGAASAVFLPVPDLPPPFQSLQVELSQLLSLPRDELLRPSAEIKLSSLRLLLPDNLLQ